MRYEVCAVTIPTPFGETVGRYLRASDQERVLVMVNGPQRYGEAGSLKRAIVNTAGVARRAGVNVLVLPYHPPEEMAYAVFDVLGALRALLSWQATRVALLLPQEYQSALFGVDAAGALLQRTLGVIGQRGMDAEQTVASIQSFVTQMPQLLDIVTGLGAIDVQANAYDGNWVEIDCRLHTPAGDGAPRRWRAREVEAPGAHRTLLDTLVRWTTAALLDIEVGWSHMRQALRERDIVSAAPYTRANARPATSGRPPAFGKRATYRLGLYWLDQQLEQALDRQERRDAAAAYLARARVEALPVETNPYRKAQEVWLSLDFEARRAWLRSCSSLSRALTFTDGAPVEAGQSADDTSSLHF